MTSENGTEKQNGKWLGVNLCKESEAASDIIDSFKNIIAEGESRDHHVQHILGIFESGNVCP